MQQQVHPLNYAPPGTRAKPARVRAWSFGFSLKTLGTLLMLGAPIGLAVGALWYWGAQQAVEENDLGADREVALSCFLLLASVAAFVVGLFLRSVRRTASATRPP